MNAPERALLLSLHPRFATAILNGTKTVELRRQRVAVPPGTPVIIYATSPVMALIGTARLVSVDTAAPSQVWRRHRAHCGITRAEYTAYMDGTTQASALILDSPQALSQTVPLSHLRATGAFHPPQSYRYLTPDDVRNLVAGHDTADELLTLLDTRQQETAAQPPSALPPTAQHRRSLTPCPPHASDSMHSAMLLSAAVGNNPPS